MPRAIKGTKKRNRKSVARQMMLTLQFSRNWWQEVRDTGRPLQAGEVESWLDYLNGELKRIIRKL